MLSGRAEQNVTYHCRNSVAYLDGIKGNYRRAVKLLSGNDLELKPHADDASTNNKFTYSAAYDGCKVRSGHIHTLMSVVSFIRYIFKSFSVCFP